MVKLDTGEIAEFAYALTTRFDGGDIGSGGGPEDFMASYEAECEDMVFSEARKQGLDTAKSEICNALLDGIGQATDDEEVASSYAVCGGGRDELEIVTRYTSARKRPPKLSIHKDRRLGRVHRIRGTRPRSARRTAPSRSRGSRRVTARSTGPPGDDDPGGEGEPPGLVVPSGWRSDRRSAGVRLAGHTPVGRGGSA